MVSPAVRPLRLSRVPRRDGEASDRGPGVPSVPQPLQHLRGIVRREPRDSAARSLEAGARQLFYQGGCCHY